MAFVETATKELVEAVPHILDGKVTMWELTRRYTATVNGEPFVRDFSDQIEQVGPDGEANFPLQIPTLFTKTVLEALMNTAHLDILFEAHADHRANPPAVAVPDQTFDLSALPI